MSSMALSTKILFLASLSYIIASWCLIHSPAPQIFASSKYSEIREFLFENEAYERNEMMEREGLVPAWKRLVYRIENAIPKEIRLNYNAAYASFVHINELRDEPEETHDAENAIPPRRKLLNAEKIISDAHVVQVQLTQEAPSRFKFVPRQEIPFILVREGTVSARILQMVSFVVALIVIVVHIEEYVRKRLERVAGLNWDEGDVTKED